MAVADKFGDLFNPKSWIRYIKKGFILGILVGLVTTVINAITTYFGVNNSGQLMASLQAGGATVIVAFAIGIIVQLTISGFVIEYINNTRNALIKWVQK